MSSPSKQIVEHIVLAKVKPDVDQSTVHEAVNKLGSLASLPQVLYLTIGPVLRSPPSPSSLSFTHLLHSRYSSTSDLNDYNTHPVHISTATTYLLPIIDDIMVVEWVAEDFSGETEVPPGSVLRVKFVKLKEDSNSERDRIVSETKGLEEKFPFIDQLTVGENIGVEMGKGFSTASIGVFRGLADLQLFDAKSPPPVEADSGVEAFVDDVFVVDYAVPAKRPVMNAQPL